MTLTRYPPELIAEARRRYVHGVFGIKRVAATLGVPTSTIARWVNPTYAERNRRASRLRKQRRRGVCELCGGETRYGGHGGSGNVSATCASCNASRSRERGIAERGHGSTVERLLEFLSDGPKRYAEIADHLGDRRAQTSEALARLRRYGLIERPERGLYQLPTKEES
jgi:hypothetical protein